MSKNPIDDLDLDLDLPKKGKKSSSDNHSGKSSTKSRRRKSTESQDSNYRRRSSSDTGKSTGKSTGTSAKKSTGKHDLFSGTPRKKVEYQYKEAERIRKERVEAARAKDRAYRKALNQKRITSKYQSMDFSDAKTGKEAHDKYKMIMDALSKEDRVRVRVGGLFDSSGDVIEAADYIVRVKLKKGKYFTVDDLVEAMNEIQDSAFDEIPDDYDPLDDLDDVF